MDVRIFKNDQVEVKEIASLRTAVGWESLAGKLENGLANSFLHYAARVDRKLVGFVRVISDGCIHANIVDLMVHPKYQNRGLGSEILSKVVTDLTNQKIEFVTLTFDPKLENFYRKAGFTLRGGGLITKTGTH